MSCTIPTTIDDPINARILKVSEDQVHGFRYRPFHEIAAQSGVELNIVLERIGAMLRAGTIRRVRQTLLANNLAAGALVAWKVSPERLNAAFDWMFKSDPFSGHVVVRTTDRQIAGSDFRLWTTVKVPQGYSIEKHCRWVARQVGAEKFVAMPAHKLFALGVGHMRRRDMTPGAKSDDPGQVIDIQEIRLSDEEWNVLVALKRELKVDEIVEDPWAIRAAEAGVTRERFCEVGSSLNQRKVIGRFSTFLEHVKPLEDGQRVTRFNGLFHWAVPNGRELEAGREVGRFHILTHAYWRQAGPEFGNVNIMAVAHGLEQEKLLQHKAAIDAHLASVGIPVSYTAVFWGGRSEIKPSEIAPVEYEKFCKSMNVDPAAMRA